MPLLELIIVEIHSFVYDFHIELKLCFTVQNVLQIKFECRQFMQFL